MNAKEIYDLKKQLDSKGIILCYSGVISQSIIEDIAENLKNKIGVDDISSSINQKLFSVFVEQVQNIMKYSAEIEYDEENKIELKSGIAMVGKENGKYFSLSGNLIEKQHKKLLLEKIETINKMNKEELKTFYKNQMQNGSDKLEQTVGLGLIYIARKASKPMEYNIDDINETHSFYSLRVTI